MNRDSDGWARGAAEPLRPTAGSLQVLDELSQYGESELRMSLAWAAGQVRAVIPEELETTNEELQSTVEELETTNEELQSTNEELETMNEELQSMNDELQSTNEELRERTTEISTLNQFRESILSSLNAGVVVVNQELIVQVWNRQAEDMWGLREEETVGQHLLNLDSGLPAQELNALVRDVIQGESAEAETALRAVNRRGRAIQLRVAVTPLLSDGVGPSGALLVMEGHEEPSD